VSSYQKKIFIVGGTHGNEWTGVYIVKKYAEHFKKKYPGLDLEFIFANPEAHRINKRFKDEDLNRAFQFLGEDRPHSFEHQKAKELQALLSQDCFVIDFHTTTSNMGKTLILTSYDPLNLWVSSKVSDAFSDARIIGSPDPHKKYLASQSPHSLMIEVGPVANGILDPIVLESSVDLLDKILDSLSHIPEKIIGAVELYEEIEEISYPLDSQNEISGYIHRDFMGKDFFAVKGKFKAFTLFSGEEVEHSVADEMYPIFINEAAYYPTHQAFTLCKKMKKTF
jgi:aspartoacylase